MNALQRQQWNSIIRIKGKQSRYGRPASRFLLQEILVSRQIVYQGRKIQLAIDTTVLPDGQLVQRDVVLHPGAVAILPLLDREHVCLIRNQRPIIGATLLEIPAGTLEPGEPPEEAAVRELAEETGYRAGRWRKLTEFIPSPGVLSERTHLFLAQDLSPGPMQLEKDEDLEPQIMLWQEALTQALAGTICDAKTLIALFLWDRLRTEA
jgi:ADP-ribose pyrophosphatase